MILPLLRKELIELAGNRRTYLLRLAFAVTLFTVLGLLVLSLLENASRSMAQALGVGRSVFQTLVILQVVAVYLFQPVLIAGVFPRERESGALDLLRLTELRFGEMVVEKFLSRVLLMLTLLLISLPVYTYCRALGGVTLLDISVAFLLLLIACLQTAAATVMFSARRATAGQALFATYLFLGLFYLGTFLVLGLPLGILSGFEPLLVLFFVPCPPALLFHALHTHLSVTTVVLVSLPSIGTVVGFLFLAERNLRLSVSRHYRLPRLHEGAHDQRTRWVLRRLHGYRAADHFPGDRPVAWREAGQRSILRPEYLRANLTLLVLGICLATATAMIQWAIVAFWTVVVVHLVHTGSRSLVTERAQGTLDLLLVTALTPGEIVKQKYQGLLRAMMVFAVVLVVGFVAEMLTWRLYPITFMEQQLVPSHGLPPLFYLLLSVATLAVYLPMFGWFAMWQGLRLRSTVRAGPAALLIVFVWVLLPYLLTGGAIAVFPYARDTLVYGYLLSPAWLVQNLEFQWTTPGVAHPYVYVILGLAWHALLWALFRFAALTRVRRGAVG